MKEYKKCIVCKVDDTVDELYKYKDEIYCFDCLLQHIGVEESVHTSYYQDGEYLFDENSEIDKELMLHFEAERLL